MIHVIRHGRVRFRACVKIRSVLRHLSLFVLISVLVLSFHLITHGAKRQERRLAEIQGSDDLESIIEGYDNNNARIIPTAFAPYCEEWELSKRLPDAILIGERKTGTSTTLKFLRQMDPRIKTALVGEPHFFDVAPRYSKGLEYYRNLFQPACPSDAVIEKTPSYFRTPVVTERVYACNASMKLMVSMRDPIDRAVSDFYFEKRRHEEGLDHTGNIDLRSTFVNQTFEDVVLTEQGEIDAEFPPIARSLYEVSLLRWLTKFPLKQFHLIDADLFIKDPVTVLRRIEVFLGLEPMITPDMVYLAKMKGYYCVRGRRCNGTETGHKYDPISDELHKKMKVFFRPHVSKLYKLTNRKLSWMSKYLE